MYRESNSNQVTIATRVWFLYLLHHVAVSQPVAATSWERELAKRVYNYANFTVSKTDPTARTKNFKTL